ncbi:MAG: efflux transporter periplasmic adaptor subunit, partial [Comamonadaceae bacterium]
MPGLHVSRPLFTPRLTATLSALSLAVLLAACGQKDAATPGAGGPGAAGGAPPPPPEVGVVVA